jgi:hypothetical protein
MESVRYKLSQSADWLAALGPQPQTRRSRWWASVSICRPLAAREARSVGGHWRGPHEPCAGVLSLTRRRWPGFRDCRIDLT